MRKGSPWIGDCTDLPLKIALHELAAARSRIKKYRNRVLWLGDPIETKKLDTKELRRLVLAGLDRCRKQLAAPALKASARNFQLDAIERWAGRLHASSAKDGWEKVFTPGRKLWRGLTSIYDCIEYYGTGGSLCRFHMADFLEEAGEALDLKALSKRAASYRGLGEAWSELARSALPEDVPEMRRARELLGAKAELVHDAAPPEKVREVWNQLDELEQRVSEEFPLSSEDADSLRGDLKERALAIHAAEVAALAALEHVER